MRRRDFLKLPAALALCGLGGCRARAADDEQIFWRRASWWKEQPGARVRCTLCPRGCTVPDGGTGWCRTRSNRKGVYYTKVFGRLVSLNNDPIEKKPLFHFRPGTDALSVATAGCNFECLFCQNWELSQAKPEELPTRRGFVSPETLVALAQQRGSRSIAFTYGEPIAFFEYMLATARLSREAGIPGVMISNGCLEPGPLDELLEVLGAIKVDFKAYDEGFYNRICSGQLKPVLATMERIHKKGLWLEMVHLTVPTLNDKPEQTKALCAWVLDHLGPDVPLHFTRFHPTYKLRNLPATPPSTLEGAWEIARAAGIHYPYVGNLPGHEGENTRCHSCGELLIRRMGYVVTENHLKDGKCPKCQTVIPGVWT